MEQNPQKVKTYRGRIAPTPTGYLHLGHARTFTIAMQRATQFQGTLIFRNEDLDQARCKAEYIQASIEDLKQCGLSWQEGPLLGGSNGPYNQSERLDFYLKAWRQLQQTGLIYPCDKSRKDVQNALQAPHLGDNSVFPPQLRPPEGTGRELTEPGNSNWRFRVPDGTTVSFIDKRRGPCSYIAGEDFGDFLIWRKDGFPSYEMAVVVDDHEMAITEVVRGEDLLLSTARQILLYKALDWDIPDFYHCELIKDENGERLAKRHKSLSLREIHGRGEWEAVKKTLDLH